MLILPLNLIILFFSLLHLPAFRPEKGLAAPVRIGHLPAQVTESSGLERAGNGNLYTINDAGNDPVLFKISGTGKLIQAIPVTGATNSDWEDLARDASGNIYISDTGNNSNKRTTLRIYKTTIDKEVKFSEILFKYQDRVKIKKTDKKAKAKDYTHNFDCEAIFWSGGKLYLISKDRGHGKTAKVYELPDSPGLHEAKLLGSRNLDVMITAADISPNGKKVGLLGHGKLLIFDVNGSVRDFIKATPKSYSISGTGQVEGLVFTDNNSVVFSNEGGTLYRLNL